MGSAAYRETFKNPPNVRKRKNPVKHDIYFKCYNERLFTSCKVLSHFRLHAHEANVRY